MNNRGRGRGRGVDGQNINRGGDGNSNGQISPCTWCKKDNHVSNDCRFKRDKNQNVPKYEGGNGGKGGNGNRPKYNEYFKTRGHVNSTCFKSLGSPNYRGPRGKGGRGGSLGQNCETRGWVGHLASSCQTTSGKGGFHGQEPPTGQKTRWGRSAFSRRVPIDQDSAFQKNTFNTPQQQQPFEAMQPDDDSGFAPQVKTNGKWNRQYKNCQQWHADCRKAKKEKKDNKMVDSGYNSGDEKEEPRWQQVMPFLQRSGLMWDCPRSGSQFDVDSEGDVIMLETVGTSLSLP